ncbi:MAG: hypothetical protein E7168_01855 [Firmicutes bacterium]|nr:hypothetical protein [Bacillota bacterium]
MGLLEKLKNTFFEEEYVEVTEEEKKKKEPKPIAKKVEAKPVKVESNIEENTTFEQVEEEPKKEVVFQPEIQADKELLKTDTSISYFEDDDFVPVKPVVQKEEKKPLYGQDPEKLYKNISYEKTTSQSPYSNTTSKAAFKPTPIISPIYGILDKNYKKEEVVDKKDKPSSYVSRKHADLDFVRNKAFGSVREENPESSFKDKIEKEEITEDESLLYDMTGSNEAPSVSKVTIADAEEYFEDLGLEYNVDYKDSRYEKATGRRSKITKEEVSDRKPVKYPEFEDDGHRLEDNLFDLIDSMYEERG